MSVEHYRPNGNLSQGYVCCNCGKPCGMMGHMNFRTDDFDCIANPELVRMVRLANPPPGVKPRFKFGVK